MRLCFLAEGASVHSYRWVRFFAERGHEVSWLSYSPNAFAPIPGVRFVILGGEGVGRDRASRVARGVWTLRRGLLAELKPEVLHAHYVGLNGTVAALSGFRPLVLTAWGSDVLFAGRKRLLRPLIRFALQRADVVTCDAQHLARAIHRLAHVKRLEIVHFGTDTGCFRPQPRDEKLASDLGLDGRGVVISLRSLLPVYDIASLIQSVPSVLASCPNAVFLIAGTGSDEGRLRELVDNLGVSRSVLFVGQISPANLPRYLSVADVYVSTALSDAGLSASTAEAMASGIPVVITDSGENRLWVQDGVNGYVVPCGDTAALAVQLIALLQHESLRREFAQNGRRTILERNDYGVEMSKMEALYQALA